MIGRHVISAIAAFAAVSVCAMSAHAQMMDLKGRVLDKADNKPIPGATVKLQGSALTATTDTAGRFTLKGNATGLIRGASAWIAAPYFKDGALHVQSALQGIEAEVEIFSVGGESLAHSRHPLQEGWNSLKNLPAMGRDFLGFARITLGQASWVTRILQVSGHMQASQASQASGRAGTASARLAKGAAGAAGKAGAAGNVEVSMAKLMSKTVAFANDAADLGDIYLDYPARKLDVGAQPIYGAKVLFDGTKGKAAAQAELAAKWQDWPRFTPSAIMFKIAKDPEFPNDTNRVTVQSCCNTNWGMDDIQAKDVHGDAQLHVEWIGMGQYDQTEDPDLGGQVRSGVGYINSGVYIQSRYEVQIETPGVSDAKHTMASLVDDFAADLQTPNRGNGKWQAYDITFRSARYNQAGTRTENARITVWWNGVVVHDNRDAKAPATGIDPSKHSGEDLTPILYGLKLQSEGRDVRFRNMWFKPLDIKDPQTKFGY